MTQGLITHHLSVLAFLFNHILHCICFKILVTESKYLVFNWRYTHLIRAKKVKKLNKKFKIFRVIITLPNHYFIILKLLWAIKGFILYKIKHMALKPGYNFTTCGNFTDTYWIEELQNPKPLSYLGLWLNIYEATGFEPLHHILHAIRYYTAKP